MTLTEEINETMSKNAFGPLSGIHVLVIDDDKRLITLLRTTLEIFGFHSVDCAYNAEEAWQMLKDKEYHFMICDWHMHGADGVVLVKSLRKSEHHLNRFIPIILLTGKTNKEDIEEARDAGITDFLAKPFTTQSLKEHIIDIIENPRDFIITPTYIGPDRRRKSKPLPDGMKERRNMVERIEANTNHMDNQELNTLIGK